MTDEELDSDLFAITWMVVRIFFNVIDLIGEVPVGDLSRILSGIIQDLATTAVCNPLKLLAQWLQHVTGA